MHPNMAPMSITSVLTVASFISITYCWGALGHRAVAYLAEQYMMPIALEYTDYLLDGEDISEASLWPDQIRGNPAFDFTSGWHYIDAEDDPPDQCGVRYRRDCDPRDGCVVSAIVNQTERAISRNTTVTEKGQALKYLLHFIGDIHQPLHTEAESHGGNDIDVRFDNRSTTLHFVWDTAIPEKWAGQDHDDNEDEQKAAALAWAQDLYVADDNPDASLAAECQDLSRAQECSLSHANDANQWICGYVLQDEVEGVKGQELSGDYYEGAVPIVELLIAKAGVRLAAWINALATLNASDAITNSTAAAASSSNSPRPFDADLDLDHAEVEESAAPDVGLGIVEDEL